MANEIFKQFTTTSQTYDSDAIRINSLLDDVTRMSNIGSMLKEIRDSKFCNNSKLFKRWVRMNIDKDEKSVIRYIALADNIDLLKRCGIIKLSEAYEILGIDGNLKELEEYEAK